MLSTSPSPVKASPWLIFWLLCAPFLTLGILSLPLAWIAPHLIVSTGPFLALSIGLTEATLAAWAWWGTRRIRRRHWTVKPQKLIRFPRVAVYGLGLGIMLNGALIGLSTLFLALTPGLAHSVWGGNTGLFAPALTHARGLWLLLFAGQIIGVSPLVEEWFFRSMLWSLWRSRTSSVYTAIYTALAFAAYHMTWHAFLPLALVGLVLGLLRHRYGVRLTWGVHAGFNALTFGLLLWHP